MIRQRNKGLTFCALVVIAVTSVTAFTQQALDRTKVPPP